MTDSAGPTVTSPARLCSTRRFGKAEVSAIYGGTIALPTSFLDGPVMGDLDDEGRIVFGCTTFVVRTGKDVVVVDPGSALNEQTSRWRMPGPEIEEGLAELALTPEDVTHVVITHGHTDHLSGVLRAGQTDLRFPEAEHHYPAGDLVPSVYDRVRAFLDPVREAGLLRTVQGDTEVVAGVTLLSAPGETPGHQVLRLVSEEERFYHVGDLVHFVDEVDDVGVCPFDRDIATLATARKRMFGDAAGTPSRFVFAHGRFPCWGRIEQAGSGTWSWSYD